MVKAEEACVDGEAWEPGEPAFEDVSDEWGLDEIGANGQRLSVTDLDGDGWPDLSVRRAGTTSGDDFSSDSREDRVSWLLKNDGGEGFEDVTQESGLVQSRSGGEDEGRPVDTIIWADVDNDGDLDAYTSFNRQNSTDDEEADTAEVMLNDGDGNFEFADDDTIRRLGEPDSPGGASFTDVDRDGNVDLWVTQYADANGPLQDRLYLGDGEGGFEEATEEAGLQTEPWENLDDLNEARAHSVSWGANACDLNDDGTPELLAASYGRAPNHLWLGELDDDGNLSYENHSIDSGYAFDDRTDWTDNESARCYCKHNPDAEDCDGVPEPEHIACE
ncbi:MAG: FG-GAP repeat domain-containing protein, partial [Persicimonas sp.]